MNTFALLRLGHPSGVPSSWCPLSLQPENPGQSGKNVRSLAGCSCCSGKRAWTHHWEQTQRMKTPRRAGRQRFIPKVLQLLLSFMENLQALGVLVLQLSQLDQRRESSERRQNSSVRGFHCFENVLLDNNNPLMIKKEDQKDLVLAVPSSHRWQATFVILFNPKPLLLPLLLLSLSRFCFYCRFALTRQDVWP